MNPERRAFLAGDEPDEVLVFFAESAVSDLGTLSQHGEQVSRGVVLVLEAERGRSAFEGAYRGRPDGARELGDAGRGRPRPRIVRG